MKRETAEERRAAAYIRESTEDQIEFSPEAQRKALQKYAQQNGYTLDERYIFSDEGISGRLAQKRPAFLRMIAEAKSKERPFDVILVWKFSRFARNQEESIVYKSMLRRDGVEVVSVTEPILDGPFGTLIERIIEWMDEYYSIRLAEEVKKGMMEKALRGGLQNAPPFGYAVSENRLRPVPAEAELVRELFARYLAGQGLFPLAGWLNGLGVRTRRGNRFESRSVEYILRNPVYIGKLRWNPSGRTRRDYHNRDIILADAGHEALIDEKTFSEAQHRLDAQKAQRPPRARPVSELKDWPSGLVRCAACGTTLVFVRPHYYQCGRYLRGGCGHSQHIGAELLKTAVMQRLRQDTASSLPLHATILPPTGRSCELSRLFSFAKELEKKLERLREAYLNGAEPLEEYRSGRESLLAELDGVRARIREWENSPAPCPDHEALLRAADEAVESLRTPLAGAADIHRAVVSVVESCAWDKSRRRLVIVYRALP
jgi:DNA invertase Pin-like site-specific DNA recombinase